MKVFRVEWTDTIFAATVLASDGTECRAVAEKFNAERDGRLGHVKAIKVKTARAGILGWDL